MQVIGAGQTARGGLAFLFSMALLLASAVAVAGSFSVSPVRVTITPDRRVVALKVHNTGSEPASVQAELMDWTQRNGEDEFTPSREVLVTPPIFTLPPGEAQVIRVGLRRPPDPERELSYRLFLQELPPPIPENFQGLQVVTRMSLPVFVAPASAEAAPQLRWHVHRGAGGELLVSARNTGNGHAQVTQLRLQPGDGRQYGEGDNAYVLPGAEHAWSIIPKGEPIAAGSELVLTANVNGDEISIRQQGVE